MRGVWCRRGRGVISATRGGKSVYVDTHPSDTSLDWPLVMPLQHPLEIEESGAAVAAQQASMISPLGHSLRDSAGDISDSGDGNAWSSMRNGVSKKPVSLGDGAQEASPAIPSESIPLSVETAAGLGGAKPRWGLGDMSRRGMLVRSKMRFSCLSVIGVRFVKAATWCKSCGQVGSLMSSIFIKIFGLAPI